MSPTTCHLDTECHSRKQATRAEAPETETKTDDGPPPKRPTTGRPQQKRHKQPTRQKPSHTGRPATKTSQSGTRAAPNATGPTRDTHVSQKPPHATSTSNNEPTSRLPPRKTHLGNRLEDHNGIHLDECHPARVAADRSNTREKPKRRSLHVWVHIGIVIEVEGVKEWRGRRRRKGQSWGNSCGECSRHRSRRRQ